MRANGVDARRAMHDGLAAGDRGDDRVERGDVADRAARRRARRGRRRVSRTSAATACPASTSRRATARPRKPVAPVSSTRIDRFSGSRMAFTPRSGDSHVASSVHETASIQGLKPCCAPSFLPPASCLAHARAPAQRRGGVYRPTRVRRVLPRRDSGRLAARRRAGALSARSRFHDAGDPPGLGPLRRRHAGRRLCDRRNQLQPARLGAVHRDRRQPRPARRVRTDRRRAGRGRAVRRIDGRTHRAEARRSARFSAGDAARMRCVRRPPARGCGMRRSICVSRSMSSAGRRGAGEFPERSARRCRGRSISPRSRTISATCSTRACCCRCCCR